MMIINCFGCHKKVSVYDVVVIGDTYGELNLCFKCIDELSDDEIAQKLESFEKISQAHEKICNDPSAKVP